MRKSRLLSALASMLMIFPMVLMLLTTGCVSEQQGTMIALDGAVMVSNFDKVKEAIKGLPDLTDEEQAIIDSTETAFDKVYAEQVQDPSVPVSYAQLEIAAFSLVDTYDAVKAVVQRHWDSIPAQDQIRLKDFDTRATRLYQELKKAKDNEDYEAFKESTGKYLELVGTVAKIAAVTL